MFRWNRNFVLEVNNKHLLNYFKRINIEDEIHNYIKNNTIKEFKYNKFEINSFILSNITKNLFTVEENDEKNKMIEEQIY